MECRTRFTYINNYHVNVNCVFLLKSIPKEYHRAKVQIVEPKAISNLLKTSVLTSRLWIFKGSSGRYLRSHTLLEMAKGARRDSLTRNIIMFTLNPLEQHICNEYTEYRAGVKTGINKERNTQDIVHELFATFLTAFQYADEQPLLSVEYYWLNHFSCFRYDLSDEHLILTKEDPEAHALKYDAGTYFYDSFKDDLLLLRKQSISIDLYKIKASLHKGAIPTQYHNLNVNHLQILMGALYAYLDTTYNIQSIVSLKYPQDYEDILQKYKNPSQPYK